MGCGTSSEQGPSASPGNPGQSAPPPSSSSSASSPAPSSSSSSSSPPLNRAFLFIKPHAVTPSVDSLVRSHLASHNIVVSSSGTIAGADIEARRLIDNHYYAIASKATLMKPNQLPVNEEKFNQFFKVDWNETLHKGCVYNASDACSFLGIAPVDLNSMWLSSSSRGKLCKFGGGFYCAHIDAESGLPDEKNKNQTGIYVFNGFFMVLRAKFVAPDAKIVYFNVEWNKDNLSWKSFRNSVLGVTDPSKADEKSLRGIIMRQWKELGLPAEPTTGDNGVHASASPFEGLCERLNWLGPSSSSPSELLSRVAADAFGSRLTEAGMPAEVIVQWTKDPRIGEKGVFDTVEDTDHDECVKRLMELYKESQQQS